MNQNIVRDCDISSPFQKKFDPESTVVLTFIRVQTPCFGHVREQSKDIWILKPCGFIMCT